MKKRAYKIEARSCGLIEIRFTVVVASQQRGDDTSELLRQAAIEIGGRSIDSIEITYVGIVAGESA